MNETYTIVLPDGTTFEHLTRNGNNYISSEKIEATNACFENCSPLIIRCGDTEERHEHAALIHVTQHGTAYWFAFRDISEEELAAEKLRSDLDYVAMMADIDLEVM